MGYYCYTQQKGEAPIEETGGFGRGGSRPINDAERRRFRPSPRRPRNSPDSSAVRLLSARRSSRGAREERKDNANAEMDTPHL